MVQTNTNWLSDDETNEAQIDTTTTFDPLPNEPAFVADEPEPLPMYDVAVEDRAELMPYDDPLQKGNTETLDLTDIDEIYQTGDFERLHPFIKNGSLVVLPKEQLSEFMAQMRDNMVLLNGLNTLADVIKPLVQESEEGKALVSLLAENASLFSGKEIDYVSGFKLLTKLPTIIGHFKALMGKANFSLLKDNKDFSDNFIAVLKRNNSPFLTTIHTIGNSMKQLNP